MAIRNFLLTHNEEYILLKVSDASFYPKWHEYYVVLPLNDFFSNWLLPDSSLFKKERKQQTKQLYKNNILWLKGAL